MSSLHRTDASRANGALSRSPATPQGRARSDAAAIKHGLTSRRVLLDTESQEDFQALHDLYFAHFEPRDPYERDLVEQLVAARWRLDRAWSVETALLDAQVVRSQPEIEKQSEVCDTETRVALAFQELYDQSRALAGLGRYESRYRRICDRLAKMLEALRANRKLTNEPSSENEHP